MSLYYIIQHDIVHDIVHDIDILVYKEEYNNQIKYTDNDIIYQFYILESQVVDLKTMSDLYDIDINFDIIDALIIQGEGYIYNNNIKELDNIIYDINIEIQNINYNLNEYTLEQEFNRAKIFADMYLLEIDVIIDDIKKHQIHDNIISEISIIKDNIKSANTTDEIILEIKKMIIIRDQLDLNKKYILESKLNYLEQIIHDTDSRDLSNLKHVIKNTRYHIHNNNHEIALHMIEYLERMVLLYNKTQ